MDNVVAHPLWRFMQGALTWLIALFMALASWYLSGVNAKLERLADTQSMEIRLRERLDYRVERLEEFRKDSEQRGNLIRDRLTQLETHNKILEDRIARKTE